jgi:signal transduction histidine kinase
VPEAPTLRERLGGRWAISFKGWVVLTLIVLLSLPLGAQISDPSVERRAITFGLTLITMLAVGVVLAAANVTVFRNRATQPVPIWMVVGLGIVIGIVQSGAADILFHLADLGPDAYPHRQLLLAPFIAAVVMIVVILVLDDVERYRIERERLLRRAADLQARVVERSELTRSIESAVNDEVLTTTRAILGDLDRAHPGMSREERLEMARELQRTAHHELRPLSQRLFATPMAPVPEAKLIESLRATLGRQPVPIWWCTAAVTAVTALFLATRTGPTYAVASGLLQGATVLVTLAIVVRLGSRNGVQRGWLLPIAAAAASGTSTVRTIALQQFGIAEPDATLIVINIVWAALLTIATSMIVAALGSRDASLRELEYEVDEQVLEAVIANRELVRVSRELAGHVHGTLQSTLLATAFAIENATRANDGPAFDAAVEGARVALAGGTQAPRGSTDLAAEIQRHIDLWSEFTDVSAVFDVPDALPVDVVADVARVVEEGIGNAKKHGAARRIQIAVDCPEPRLLRVRISDDGSGPRGGAPGLGSSLLDEIAADAWSLQPNPTGTGSLLVAELRLG